LFKPGSGTAAGQLFGHYHQGQIGPGGPSTDRARSTHIEVLRPTPTRSEINPPGALAEVPFSRV
jgi:hypothetical protein